MLEHVHLLLPVGKTSIVQLQIDGTKKCSSSSTKVPQSLDFGRAIIAKTRRLEQCLRYLGILTQLILNTLNFLALQPR